MILPDWTKRAAEEIDNFPGNLSIPRIMKIIQKYCPFKKDTVYVEYSGSAQEFIKRLLYNASWYHSALELDNSKCDGEDLKREALKIIGEPPDDED